MSELVTCVLAALYGFCAVWKFAISENRSPNGGVSSVPTRSGSCAIAALLDMAMAAAHAAVTVVHLPLIRPPQDVGRGHVERHPLDAQQPTGGRTGTQAHAAGAPGRRRVADEHG